MLKLSLNPMVFSIKFLKKIYLYYHKITVSDWYITKHIFNLIPDFYGYHKSN